MAKIHTLTIRNFRSIESFEQVFGFNDFICIIGRGDSGKTTILESIAYVLSPNWNLSFYDTDFINCDINTPIQITVTLYDLPKKLLTEDKYGLYKSFLDRNTGIVQDNALENSESVITIQLQVNKDLEPKWYVINSRQSPIEMKSTDRASLNVFLVSDYVDKHFSWSKGNPLYSLLQLEAATSPGQNIVLDALRQAKAQIDTHDFEHLDPVVSKVKSNAAYYGVNISNAKTTIDFKDIAIKDGRVCLHDLKIPFKLKGKGSRRIISISIQTELAKSGGIVLIDEIEQGLESDRVQHLVKSLKLSNKGQVFLTTHSRDVVVELQAANLFLMRSKSAFESFNADMQGCLRANPEAFFAKKVLVCEGATEIGICRGINEFNILNNKSNIALMGVRFVDGKGASMINYSTNFKNAGYEVGLLCDSDVTEINEKKKHLESLVVVIIDCDESNSIEAQIFKDLPCSAIQKLIQFVFDTGDKESILSSINAKHDMQLEDNWWELENSVESLRRTLGIVANKNQWFKRIDRGEFLGITCCQYIDMLPAESKLLEQLNKLNRWFDNA